MKLWRFHDPHDCAFASAGGRGTWFQPGEGKPSERVEPLIIEWEPSSNVIGDFTWAGLGIVITQTVGQALLARFREFELGPVEMIQNPRLRRPRRVTRRTKPRVWLPYEGPPVCELWVTAWANADLERSTLRVRGTDPDTGGTLYVTDGVESDEIHWDRDALKASRTRTPREPGRGVYVAEGELGSVDIFQVRQVPGIIFCTDAVRDFVLESKFTNVDFFEMGETF
jgi:hypothetical protein